VNIVETRTFMLGVYTVQQRPRFDSPGWGQYLVFLKGVLIGKCFSCPCESDCQWLERQQREQTGYAYSSAELHDLTGIRRGKAWRNYPKRKKKSAPDLEPEPADAVEG
jgi:hypothetical protein